MAKLGDKLKYSELKNQAYPSHRILNDTGPRSGTSFNPLQQIEFSFPQDKLQEFLDPNDSLRVVMPVTATADCYLDRCGGYGMWSKVEVYQGSTMMSNVNQEGLLITALKDMGQISKDYAASSGRNMEGFEDEPCRGSKLTINVEREFRMSIHCASINLTTPKRDLYLGSKQDITIRITLAHQNTALYTLAGGAVTYTVNNPRLITNNTYLEDVTMDALNKAIGGNYQMLTGAYSHADFIINAGAPSVNLVLPFAKKSLERIIFCIRQSANVTDVSKMSLGGRTTGNMTDFMFKLKGKNHPQSSVKIQGDGTEAMFHLLQSDNLSGNQQVGNSLMSSVDLSTDLMSSSVYDPLVDSRNPYMDNGVAAANGNFGKAGVVAVGAGATTPGELSNIGKFLGGLTFESSLVTSSGSPIYSGVDTTSGQFYFNANFDTGGAGAVGGVNPQELIIDFFCLSTEYIYYNQESRSWDDSV